MGTVKMRKMMTPNDFYNYYYLDISSTLYLVKLANKNGRTKTAETYLHNDARLRERIRHNEVQQIPDRAVQ